MLKFTDYVKISPDAKLKSLDTKSKIEFIDRACESNENGIGGLVVSYDLSHSGRRINNRIYSPAGQASGVESLLSPYPKPILLNHDQSLDPIGRFIGGEFQDLSNLNYQHFGDAREIAELQSAFTVQDFEKIYSLMKKNNLLTNPNYSGLGRMRVQANIRDPKAIEKFIDGRYMTFSAGSTTDKHVCSICYSDWAQSDFCEHRHGKIYDNEICVFMTGSFQILEGSVVNTPADDLSQIISMEYYNDNNELQNMNFDTKMDPSTFYLSDSFFNLINDPEIHMENKEESSTKKVELEILENEDSQQVENEVPVNETETSTETIVEEAKVEVVEVQDDKEVEEKIEETEVKSIETIEEVLTDKSVDWYLLDCALTIELGDKALSNEEKSELSEDVFCGPNRSFPVSDHAHLEAARKLISKARLSDAEKEKVLACVEEKAEAIKDNLEKDASDTAIAAIKDEISKLRKDIEKELVDVKNLLQDKIDRLSSVKELEQADSSKEVKEVLVEETKVLKEIENPSISNSDNSSPNESLNLDSLGTFEKKAVRQYAEILNKDGEASANAFWEFKSQYLNKGFDPKKFIN
tara:strand:- start:217 stop:1956 length:1740 start_codon:yes stop_codon:yes gene_type:complete